MNLNEYVDEQPRSEPAHRPGPGTNAFAIVALVTGLLGLFPLGLVFGLLALPKIRRTGERGRGLAIAGIVLSGITLVAVVAGVLIGLAGSADPRAGDEAAPGADPTRSAPAAQPAAPGDPSEAAGATFRNGQCLSGLANVAGAGPSRIDCGKAHEAEVVGSFLLPGTAYPGKDAISKQANQRCNQLLTAYSPSAQSDPAVGLQFTNPSRQTWEQQRDREVTCLAVPAQAETVTGSIRGR